MSLIFPREWGDSIKAERVEALRAFGFTERQARFLVTVLVHSGVFIARQYAAFAVQPPGELSTHDSDDATSDVALECHMDTGMRQRLGALRRQPTQIPRDGPVVFDKRLEVGGRMIARVVMPLQVRRRSLQHASGRNGLSPDHRCVAFLQYRRGQAAYNRYHVTTRRT